MNLRKKLIENGFKPLPDWKDALNRYLKEIDLQTNSPVIDSKIDEICDIRCTQYINIM